MDLKNLQPTYTMRDMAKVLGRVAQLTRENNRLREQLETITKERDDVIRANADLTSQLDDMQRDFAGRMTAPQVLTFARAEC
jgi:cell shape-determining protein MreC